MLKQGKNIQSTFGQTVKNTDIQMKSPRSENGIGVKLRIYTSRKIKNYKNTTSQRRPLPQGSDKEHCQAKKYPSDKGPLLF